jgi:uncharacterized membrane protein
MKMRIILGMKIVVVAHLLMIHMVGSMMINLIHKIKGIYQGLRRNKMRMMMRRMNRVWQDKIVEGIE